METGTRDSTPLKPGHGYADWFDPGESPGVAGPLGAAAAALGPVGNGAVVAMSGDIEPAPRVISVNPPTMLAAHTTAHATTTPAAFQIDRFRCAGTSTSPSPRGSIMI
jgi:hypothetical protein